MKLKFLASTIVIVVWITSCVELFQVNISSGLKILVVDATLSDIASTQQISIMESANAKGTPFNTPVQNLQVELIVNSTQRIKFTETKAGIYSLPLNFKLEEGSKYQLYFKKEDGNTYQSTVEKLIKVPKILNVKDEFMPEGIERNQKYLPGNFIYLDTKDPEALGNNYLWTWQQWEKQDICETCAGGRYYPNTGCRIQPEYQGLYFDYYCDGDCWEIFKSTELNVMNDALTNGKEISNRLIAKIPYYTTNGTLIEIQQQSISKEAYQYFKLLADQTQNTGTLVDTPPAALIGNIRNVNNLKEPVAGLFMVTSIVKTSYWIDRHIPNKLKILPIGLRDHTYSAEPPIPNEFGRPPLVKCILGSNRTPIKPLFWPN
ncbi:hypothetical protein Emtol_3282 [Emticicia oligotrophica DSM 17448]|uniref:DUF4249 domain-containing protein n=1 Tax=Emticicia oligotrophica (strain DSM 17448 / CIP 109782 / MTCC 6937 / GPTSA100-15) TaxID=929562 RepID=A0ABN4ASR4_EMTOG|nr:DUF4249 domain-containing protein [Emticicia oligotrophica]AFK04411.1 hypothetical protein Emtol_3282 [Emticicia oligotrophica DSM 17448]